MKDSERKKGTAEAVSRLLDLELVFVTGKGGVGKSSISAALALTAATANKRVLVVYPEGTTPPHSDWGSRVSEKPRSISPNLDVLCIDPETAMRQYVGEVLGSTKLAAVLFHPRVAQGLLTGIPGPSDWAILGKAWSLTKTGAQHRARGETPYDLVILDAPSSGDGSGMLKVPEVILELAPDTQLRSDAQSCLELLRDTARSAIVFVTLAEQLALSETEENIALVRQDLKMPVGPVFVNQLIAPRFSSEDRAAILALPEPETAVFAEEVEGTADADGRADLCLNASYIQASREQLQDRYLERIDGWQIPTIRLPRLEGELSGEKALEKLQMALAQAH